MKWTHLSTFPNEQKIFNFPAGTYELGSLKIADVEQMTINVEEGAFLKATNDQTLYPVQGREITDTFLITFPRLMQ